MGNSMKSDRSHDDIAAARFLTGAASLDDAIDQAFSELPRKVRTIIRRWAVQDEPNKHGKPIHIKTLAKKCNLGRTTLYNYLLRAKNENPKVFALLKKYRKQRAYQTGGYNIR
jgi:hypothetical protein